MKIHQYTNKGNREENQDFVIHGSLPDNAAFSYLRTVWGAIRMELLHQKLFQKPYTTFLI